MRSRVGIVLHNVKPYQAGRLITPSRLLSFANRQPSTPTNTHATSGEGSSLHNTHIKPKVFNSDITGSGLDPEGQLTDEQKKEVTEHNSTFPKNSIPRKEEKVDNRFWHSRSKG